MVYTDDTSKNVYVLDNQNKRIAVLDKEGTYLAQYAWEEPQAFSGFVVSEPQKKIFLLAGGKIYALELK